MGFHVIDLVVATRRSPLALAQTELVAGRLRAAGHTVTLLPVVTTGDRWSDGGGPAVDKGLFVKELEEALLDGRADLAVHSAKDLPGALPRGLGIIAVPVRANAADVIVGVPGGLGGLPDGARVATGSPRRHAQLITARPDLTVVDIRGNVDTRLAKLAAGVADALVLAAAGIDRLGISPPHATELSLADFVPAPGQGCLAIEARTDRDDLAEVAALLADGAASLALRAERAVLAALGGGCMSPVGAHCSIEGDELTLRAFSSPRADRAGVSVVATDGLGDPEGLALDVAEALQVAVSRA